MSALSAQVYLDTHRTVGAISPLLFGGFAEHMGRCVYEGIYDPASPHAVEDGLRTDVMAALRELGYTVIRYPGGNFLSGYHWLDGIGPKEKRPRRRDLAWFSIETNQFGTDEFMTFCRKVGTAPMLGVNLGTGTIDSASALVEYCNAPAGTYYADLRAANGSPEPYGVKYWCLGNEMDGPWQIGHLDMHEYANKAREAAKLMRWQDPAIETVLCGSSNDRMPTFPEWDRVALETCWEHVNYLSIHMYVSNHHDQDTPSHLALARRFEDFVDTMAGTLRYVKAKNRSRHNVYLSWDEWQVWHPGETNGRWTEAPHLAEVGYNLEDALVVAQWLNVFLRKCDVVKVACMAQIVNIISWLHTAQGLLKHTSYYPFMLVSNHARQLAGCAGQSAAVRDEAVRHDAAARCRGQPRPGDGPAVRLHCEPEPDGDHHHGAGMAGCPARTGHSHPSAHRNRYQGRKHLRAARPHRAIAARRRAGHRREVYRHPAAVVVHDDSGRIARCPALPSRAAASVREGCPRASHKMNVLSSKSARYAKSVT